MQQTNARRRNLRECEAKTEDYRRDADDAENISNKVVTLRITAAYAADQKRARLKHARAVTNSEHA